jgi:hypothetical protein
MGVSTGVGDGDTLGAANGLDLWDSWDLLVNLISPISHIGPIGSRSPGVRTGRCDAHRPIHSS